MVSGTTGNDADTSIRRRNGHQQSTRTCQLNENDKYNILNILYAISSGNFKISYVSRRDREETDVVCGEAINEEC